MKRRDISADSVWREYEKMLAYNDSIQLDDTVRVNENFFIGKQWEEMCIRDRCGRAWPPRPRGR